MERRRYLALAGAAASAGLAGCSLGGSDTGAESETEPEPGDATPAPTGTTGPGSTPATAEAFEVTSVQAADTTRLNEAWGFGFSVRNRTERERTFTTTISTRTLSAEEPEWSTFSGEVALDLGPGRTKTWKSPPGLFDFLATVQYRLDATGTTWTVEVLPLQLDYGLTYDSPDGLVVTVGAPRVQAERPSGTVAVAGGDATGPFTPAPTDGAEAWLVAPVAVENPTDASRAVPRPSAFAAAVGDERRDPAGLDLANRYGRADAVDAGETHEGVLAFRVPADTQTNVAEVTHERSFETGDVRVVWQ